MDLKISSAKWWPFCPGVGELKSMGEMLRLKLDFSGGAPFTNMD